MGEYAEGPVKGYLADLAGAKPAPGGGSAAALTGALGAAAAAMAANFTAGRKKYAHVEERVRKALDDLDRLRGRLLELVDEDVQAYSKVGPAYAMPRDTEEQRRARSAAVQEALRIACAVPLEACRSALEVIEACDALVSICNPMLVSDVAVGAMLAEAAFRAARVNVEINLKYIEDADFAGKTRARVEADARRARDILERVTDTAAGRMGP